MGELEDTVWEFPVGTSTSHLHGCVWGMSCANTLSDQEAFLRTLVDRLGPLLGEDDTPLTDRLADLAEWYGGCLLGFGVAAPADGLTRTGREMLHSEQQTKGTGADDGNR